jgi:hypothetical protein
MIKAENAKFPEQRELLEFMRDYSVKVSLVSEILGLSESIIHFYRRGSYADKELRMSRDLLNTLKSRYKKYMLEKLEVL